VFGPLLRNFEQPYFVRLEEGEVTGDGDDDGDLNWSGDDEVDDEVDDEEEDVMREKEEDWEEEDRENFFEGFECSCSCEGKFDTRVLHDFATSSHRLREGEKRRLVQYMIYSFTNRDEQRDTNKKRKMEKEGREVAQTASRTYVDYQVMGMRV